MEAQLARRGKMPQNAHGGDHGHGGGALGAADQRGDDESDREDQQRIDAFGQLGDLIAHAALLDRGPERAARRGDEDDHAPSGQGGLDGGGQLLASGPLVPRQGAQGDRGGDHQGDVLIAHGVDDRFCGHDPPGRRARLQRAEPGVEARLTGDEHHGQHDRQERQGHRRQLAIVAVGEFLQVGQRNVGRLAQGQVPTSIDPEGREIPNRGRDGTDHAPAHDHHPEVDTQLVGHVERSRRGRHEGMSDRASGQDAQDVQQVVLPGLKPHGLGQGDHQVEDGVEKDGDAQEETAADEGRRRPGLPQEPERGAYDAVGGAAVEKALADDRRHGDQDADFAAGAAERHGHPFRGRRSDELLGSLLRPGRLSFGDLGLCVLL